MIAILVIGKMQSFIDRSSHSFSLYGHLCSSSPSDVVLVDANFVAVVVFFVLFITDAGVVLVVVICCWCRFYGCCSSCWCCFCLLNASRSLLFICSRCSSCVRRCCSSRHCRFSWSVVVPFVAFAVAVVGVTYSHCYYYYYHPLRYSSLASSP